MGGSRVQARGLAVEACVWHTRALDIVQGTMSATVRTRGQRGFGQTVPKVFQFRD